MKYVRDRDSNFILMTNIPEIAFETAAYWLGQRTLTSAGYVRLDDENLPECYGESEVLGLTSLPEDTRLLRRQLGLPGV